MGLTVIKHTSLEMEAEDLAREALRGFFGEGFVKMNTPMRISATQKVLALLKKTREEVKS